MSGFLTLPAILHADALTPWTLRETIVMGFV